jgi:hypothetical protein
MPRTREPAWGERDAITGYYPQYRISAAHVIRALRDDMLQWIAVADPKAGRVDDFQIGSDQRVDAFQFKWTRHGGPFTFSDLTKQVESTPGLIEQLADGWRRLSIEYPHHRIVVHLITNQHPSTSDSVLPKGTASRGLRHFAAFFEQVWKPAHATHSNQGITVPAPWRRPWKTLQKASGLDQQDFERFVRDCVIEFGISLPRAEGISENLADLYLRDLEHVTVKIFEAVYDPQVIIRLNRDELLIRLGWKDRFEYRNQHYFPVNESLYEPIEKSREALEQSLSNLEGGYVGVLGSPGSGKSTLLTQSLRYRRDRVIRYYAFVPDSQSTAVRGEAVNFLHDVVRAIEDAGFRTGEVIPRDERAHLRSTLLQQLQLLNADWVKTRRKTIILVDGLDHIPREQHPSRSLLRDLPDASQIPAGVYFVLGTQTDQLDDLPNSIQFAIRQQERRIDIESLTREAVRAIIQRTDVAEALTPEQKDQVHRLSDGHPLALNYLLNELQRTTDTTAIERILEQTPTYRGQIEEQYHAYWRQIDRDDELATLLGVIARLRGVIDLKWIKSWASVTALRRLRRNFAHLFRVEDQERWYFFHNSFRLYLTQQTASWNGVFDAATDHELHLEIASKCRKADDPRWQWEELYYLFKAEAYDRFLERGTADFFREQFFAYRSLEAIRADITLGIRAAGARHDLVSLVRMMLLDAEMDQRQKNTDRVSLAPILLSLGEYDNAIEHLRDGNRLIGSPENVLTIAPLLLTHGLENEARQLFDLAEPLDLLSGAKEIRRYDPSQNVYWLRVWASAAVHFRSIEQIITAIQLVALEPDTLDTDEKTANNRILGLRHSLLFQTGLSLLEMARWDDLLEIERVLLNSDSSGQHRWFQLRTRTWTKFIADGEIGKAQSLIQETLEVVDSAALSDAYRITIADALLRSADTEQARQWIEKIGPIGLQDIPDFNFSFSIFDQLFRHARLVYTLGEQRSPTELIQDSPDSRKRGSVYFQRGICSIARIWALGWLDHPLDPASIRQDTFSLLRLFYHDWRQTRWDSWYSLVELKADFYSLLIDAISLHGPDVVRAVAEDFARELQENSRWWSSDEIRAIVLYLTRAGMGAEWATEQLENVAVLIHDLEISSRIKEEVRQVRAWMTLGRVDLARSTLKDTLLDAASVGSKDYQLGEWISWMKDANRDDETGAAKRITWFAGAVRDLERNGGPAKDAAYDLLDAATEWSPRRAVLIFVSLFSQGLIYFSDAAQRIMRVLIASDSVSTTLARAVLLHFFVPLCNDDAEVVNSVVERTFKSEGRDQVIEFARNFRSVVEVDALGSRRPSWLRALAASLQKCGIEVSEIGSDLDQPSRNQRGTSDEAIKLKDGTTLSLSEIAERTKSVADVRVLIDGQSSDSFYHWDKVIAELTPKLANPAEVMELVDLFTAERFSARIMCKLAERLLELGDLEQASTVAQLALSSAEASGWAVHLTGGPKLEAFKVLVQIKEQVARDHAFSELVKDMTLTRFFEGSTFKYTRDTIQYLREILPLLASSVPLDELWPEIESYVHSLFPSISDGDIDESLLALLSTTFASDTAAEALIDFLSLYAASLFGPLADAARMTFLKLLLAKDATAVAGLKQLMSGEEVDQECALMIIDSASQRDPDIISAFQLELQAFTEAPSIALRLVARRLCGVEGIRVKHDGDSTATPPLYGLALPPAHDPAHIRDEDETVAFDVLPDTDDPYELLQLILNEIGWAASEAGVAEENLVHRTAQIARALAADDRWSRLGERQMRWQLQLAGLKYPYRRPRSVIARRAFFRVVAELVDLELLEPYNLSNMKPVLDYYDPDAFFIKAGPTPNFTYRMPDREHSQGPIALDLTAFPKLMTEDGLVVFAEYSSVKRLEWHLPTVITQTMIASAGLTFDSDPDAFFPREVFWLIKDYPNLVSNNSPLPVVIFEDGEMRMFDSPHPVWLAFNPQLARSMGWSPTTDLLFGWLDREGKPVVWSVCWKDGIYQTPPPRLDETVGEGWAVLCTPTALSQLQDHLSAPLSQYRRVEQTDEKAHRPIMDIHRDERPLKEVIELTS